MYMYILQVLYNYDLSGKAIKMQKLTSISTAVQFRLSSSSKLYLFLVEMNCCYKRIYKRLYILSTLAVPVHTVPAGVQLLQL